MMAFLLVKYASDKKDKKEIKMAMLKDSKERSQSNSDSYRKRINSDSDDENTGTNTILTTNNVDAT